MNCTRARLLIELYRPGELTGDEQADLQQHLTTCTACAQLRSEALSFSRELAELRAAAPEPPDPHGLVRAVMSSIDRAGEGSGGMLTAIITAALRPRVRLAAAATAALLLAAFAVQTTVDAWKIAGLEQRLGTMRVAPAAAGIAGPDQVLEFIPPGRLRAGLAELLESGKLPELMNGEGGLYGSGRRYGGASTVDGGELERSLEALRTMAEKPARALLVPPGFLPVSLEQTWRLLSPAQREFLEKFTLLILSERRQDEH